MESIKDILIRRDGMSPEDADEMIKEARQAVRDGEDPEEVLFDWFGLEPDYFWELL
jgi:hypothetical protein